MTRFYIYTLSLITAAFVAISSVSASTIYGVAFELSEGPIPSQLYTIDPNTGAPALIGSMNFGRVSGIDFNPLTGTLYGVGQDVQTNEWNLITIDITTGAATAVGGTTTFNPFQDLSFRSDGTLFGTNNNNIYTLNLATGAATLVGPTGISGTGGNALAFNLSDVLYHTNDANIYTINQTNGSATMTGTINFPSDLTPARVNAMDYDTTSGILYASVLHDSGTNFIAQIDLTTGVVTDPRLTVPRLDALAVLPMTPTNGVPEGMTMLWLALPLCGMFLAARLKRA